MIVYMKHYTDKMLCKYDHLYKGQTMCTPLCVHAWVGCNICVCAWYVSHWCHTQSPTCTCCCHRFVTRSLGIWLAIWYGSGSSHPPSLVCKNPIPFLLGPLQFSFDCQNPDSDSTLGLRQPLGMALEILTDCLLKVTNMKLWWRYQDYNQHDRED